MLVLLVAAYASLYLCRANVEPAFNMLSVQHGWDNERTGAVFAIALAAYAIGKVILGALGDVLGGKRILLVAMAISIGATLLLGGIDWPSALGGAAALWMMGGLVVVNRFGQSGGWGGVVQIVGRWFPPERRGAVMGIVSTSFDVGNVVSLLVSAGLVAAGAGWRTIFLVPALLLATNAAIVVLFLREAPSDEKEEEKDQAEEKAEGEAGANDDGDTLGAVVKRLAKERAFWIAVLLSFLLTFVRAGFMTWTPKYLYDVSVAAGSTSALSGSIAKSAFFGAAGMTGSLVVGRLSDRWGPGRRVGIMLVSLPLLLLAVLALGHAGVTSPLGAALLVGLSGLFLLGPYSLLAGAMTLDVTGKRGTSTAVGIVDGVGYLGASLAAAVLGAVSKRAGWSRAFDVIAVVTLLSIAIAAIWWQRARSTKET